MTEDRYGKFDKGLSKETRMGIINKILGIKVSLNKRKVLIQNYKLIFPI